MSDIVDLLRARASIAHLAYYTNLADHAKLDREAAARIEALEGALHEIAKDLQSSIDVHEFNARHMIAEDSLQDAWAMLDLAKQQFQTDANSLQIPLSLARAALSEPNQS